MKSGHIEKLDHIDWEHVFVAIDEFDWTGLKPMLEEYGGGPSTRWYICFKRRLYDQKLIIRAANIHAGGTPCLEFYAWESIAYLDYLKFKVVEIFCKTAHDRSAPRG